MLTTFSQYWISYQTCPTSPDESVQTGPTKWTEMLLLPQEEKLVYDDTKDAELPIYISNMFYRKMKI